MNRTASKLDWLKERKDFNTNPVARAATRLLEHLYAPHGDALYPWILREIRRGNIELPHAYRTPGGFMALVEKEMAIERELARRETLMEEREENYRQALQEASDQDGGSSPENPLPSRPDVLGPLPESWGDLRHLTPEDFADLTQAPWNGLTDWHRAMNERPDTSQFDSPWEAMNHAINGQGQSFAVVHPPEQTRSRTPLRPEDVKTWGRVLEDRSKRRQAVDPMQYSAHDLHQSMTNRWIPEWEEREIKHDGDIVHRFPDQWTIRRLRDAEEAEREGERMGHCVGSYGDWVESGRSHIFSLRDPRNQPHTTVEIQPQEKLHIPRNVFEQHGVEEPAQGYPLYEDMVKDMVNNPAYHAEMFGRHHEEIQGDQASTGAKLWQIAQEFLTQRQQQPPWHGGRLTQVYGKEDSSPIAPYQARVRDWFRNLPPEAHPTNLDETPYHPEAVPSYWEGNRGGWDAAFLPEEREQDVRNTWHEPPPAPEDYPDQPDNPHMGSAAHRAPHGGVCHCPWGTVQSQDDLRRAVDQGRGVSPTARRQPRRPGDRPVRPGGSRAPARPARPLAQRRGGRRAPARRVRSQDDDWDWGSPPEAGDSASEGFQEVVDLFAPTGLACRFTETPEAIDIDYINVPEDRRGRGTGTRFMQAAASYADRSGKRLMISEVDNRDFFQRFPFLTEEAMPGRRPMFHTGERVIPRDPPTVPCATCGDPTRNGFCPRCDWSALNVNIDSDPLSNPPDPTKDLHRGIQASTEDEPTDWRNHMEWLAEGETPEAVLQRWQVPYQWVEFPTGAKELVAYPEDGDTTPLVIDPTDGNMTNAYDWVSGMSEWDLSKYYPESDFHSEFWRSPYPLYHGTSEANVPSIAENGLDLRNDSRGFRNKSIGSAIFTHPESTYTDYHYGPTFAIDTAAMKQDGYMPQVSKEGGTDEDEYQSSLAHAIGLEDWVTDSPWDGTDPETVVFHEPIPPQYLTRLDGPHTSSRFIPSHRWGRWFDAVEDFEDDERVAAGLGRR